MGASFMRWHRRPSRLRSLLIFVVVYGSVSLAMHVARALWPQRVNDALPILFVIMAIIAIPLVILGLYRDYGQPPQRR